MVVGCRCILVLSGVMFDVGVVAVIRDVVVGGWCRLPGAIMEGSVARRCRRLSEGRRWNERDLY